MFGTMGQTNVKNLGNGGTMDGDVTITGDLTVSGGISLSLNEVLQGTSTIDITDTEALLVRKDGDGGDVFIVDTTNQQVGVNLSDPAVSLHVVDTNNPADGTVRVGSGIAYSEFKSNASGTGKLIINNYASSGSSHGILFQSNGSTNMTLTAGGSLGIGATTIQQLLHLEKDDADVGIALTQSGQRSWSFGIDNSDSDRLKIGYSTTIGTNTVATFTEAGNLGISTNSPDGTLHVHTATAGSVTADGASDDLVVENSGAGGISILTPNDALGQLAFGSPADAYGAFIGWKSDDNQMTIATANDGDSMVLQTANKVTALTINSSQNVGIGVSPAHKFHVHATSTTDNEPAIWLHNNHNASNKDGTVISTTNDGSDAEVLHVRTNNTTFSNGTSLMLVRGDGNVGIGTASPESLLHIESAQNATMRIHNTTTGYAPQLLFEGNVGTNADNLLGKIDATWDGASNVVSSVRFESGADTSNKDDGLISFWTSSASSSVAERMRIDNAGNVGIGTSSPKHYSGTSGTVLSIHNSSYRGILELSGASNSDGGVIGALTFANTENTSANGALAQLYTEVQTSDSNAGDDSGGHLLFLTKPEAGTLAEAMRIDSSGNVGIGISPVASQKLHVNVASNVNFTTSANSSSLRLNAVNDVVDATIPLEINSTSTNFLSGNTTFAGNQVIYADGNIAIPATKGLFFDGGTHTYISETSGDILKVHVANVICGTFRDSGFAIEPTSKLWFDGAGDTYIHEQSDNKLDFFVGNGTRFVIDTNSRISLGNNDSSGNIYNTIFGYLAGNSVASGATSNTLIGYASGDAITTGSQNTAIGESALSGTDDGVSNVAIGNSAMGVGNAGTANTAVGSQSMIDVTGNYNTAVGMQSLFDLTSGVSNIAVGALALKFANAGESNNVAIGVEAMRDVKENGNTADSNIALGSLAMTGGTLSGDFIGNIAIGDRAMDATDTNAQTGTIAIGHHSLTALTSGAGNTAIGYTSGADVTTGFNNTLIGYNAGNTGTVDLVGGNSNTYIGFESRGSSASAINQTVIGKSAHGQGNNSVTLGNADVTDVYMAQDSGATVHCAGINFSANQSAPDTGTSSSEVLSAYEEGTWNPTFAVTSGSGSITIDPSNNTCWYKRVGSIVHVGGRIGVSAISSPSGQVSITNLPFAIASGTESSSLSTGSLILYNPASDTTGIVGLECSTALSGFLLREGGGLASGVVAIADHFDTGTLVGFQVSYDTSA